MLRRAIVFVICLQIAGLVVVFDWSGRSLEPFDQTKMVFGRVVEGFLIGLLALSIARFGFNIVPRTRLHAMAALLIAANVIATIFAEDRYTAVYGSPLKYLGLTFVIEMGLLYVAAAVALREGVDWMALAAAIGAASLIAGAYALVQFGGYDPLAWTTDPTGRPFGTVGNPDTLSHFLSVATVAAGACAVLYSGSYALVVRGTALMLAALGLVVVGIVAARGSVLALTAAALALPFVYARARPGARGGVRALVAFELAVSFVVVVAIGWSPLGSRLAASLEGLGLRERALVWVAAFEAFRDRPVLGYGPDNFAVAWPRYRPAELTLLSPGLSNDSAHSWPLQAAATTGLFGLAGLVGFLVATAVLLYRHAFQTRPVVGGVLLLGLTGYVAQALVSVGSIAVDWVPWLVAGAGAAIVGSKRPATHMRTLGALQFAPAIACVVILGALGLRALDANREGFAAKKAAEIGQGDVGIVHGVRSIELDNSRAQYWNELGRAYFANRDYVSASDAFAGAHDRALHDATYLSNLGRSLAQLAARGDGSRGGAPAALDAARAAVATDPNDILPYMALADIAGALKRPEEALEAILGAWRLYPGNRYEETAATYTDRVTDLGSARLSLEQAVQARDSAILRVALGRVALRQGDRASARENAARALELQPGNPDARALARDAGG